MSYQSSKSIWKKILDPRNNPRSTNVVILVISGLFTTILWIVFSIMIDIEKAMKQCAIDCPNDARDKPTTTLIANGLIGTLAGIASVIAVWVFVGLVRGPKIFSVS
jgi:flagellar biosynthesis protein FlhB